MNQTSIIAFIAVLVTTAVRKHWPDASTDDVTSVLTTLAACVGSVTAFMAHQKAKEVKKQTS